jgi:ABC-2 type transport system permease protein
MWYAVVYRGLLSIVPMAWNGNPQVGGQLSGIEVEGPQDLTRILDLSHNYAAFGTADLWIGAAVGIAMIVAATRLRRWRDEG